MAEDSIKINWALLWGIVNEKGLFPFFVGGRIAAEQQLRNCTEFLDIVILTLNDSLVAYFVASLDVSLCREMTAVDLVDDL